MSNIISGLAGFLDSSWIIIQYIYTDIVILIGLIINPILLLMVVLTLSNIYVVLKSHTRKEIILNYGSFFGMFASVCYSALIAIIPIISLVISSIVGLISAIMASAPVTVLGTGVSPGTIVVAAVLIILAVYSIFSI